MNAKQYNGCERSVFSKLYARAFMYILFALIIALGAFFAAWRDTSGQHIYYTLGSTYVAFGICAEAALLFIFRLCKVA